MNSDRTVAVHQSDTSLIFVQSPAFQFLRRMFARFDQKPRAAFRPILKIDGEFLFPLPKKISS
jgi:hypothetical protein